MAYFNLQKNSYAYNSLKCLCNCAVIAVTTVPIERTVHSSAYAS